MDNTGLALIYDYGRAYLPGDVSPGEEVSVSITVVAPTAPGRYQVKLDMVDELEALLGIRVDLVMTGALKPSVRPEVEREAIRVA